MDRIILFGDVIWYLISKLLEIKHTYYNQMVSSSMPKRGQCGCITGWSTLDQRWKMECSDELTKMLPLEQLNLDFLCFIFTCEAAKDAWQIMEKTIGLSICNKYDSWRLNDIFSQSKHKETAYLENKSFVSMTREGKIPLVFVAVAMKKKSR